jgi:hypothetical protein
MSDREAGINWGRKPNLCIVWTDRKREQEKQTSRRQSRQQDGGKPQGPDVWWRICAFPLRNNGWLRFEPPFIQVYGGITFCLQSTRRLASVGNLCLVCEGGWERKAVRALDEPSVRDAVLVLRH